MPTYLSPGVYVEEVPPAASPIAGVGTSTAGFIGIVPDSLIYPSVAVAKDEKVGTGDNSIKSFPLKNYPVVTDGTFQVRVGGTAVTTGVSLTNDASSKKSSVVFTAAPENGKAIVADYPYNPQFVVPAAKGEAKLCTNFSEFKQFFGDFSIDSGQNNLAHAVYGFFNNGGTACYVARINPTGSGNSDTTLADLTNALAAFEAIDEIALVAIPGMTVPALQEAVLTHCEKLKDRFAILDGNSAPTSLNKANIQTVRDSSYGAIYFPWIQVADPVTGIKLVPPSGYIAGVYARTDAERGVFKAPANAAIRGALDVDPNYRLTQGQQDLLNPSGINALRLFSGNVKIWGARTMGGDANGEFKYISTRRLLNFLRESIEDGTQFAVFEPNSTSLWKRIERNVGDFLLGQWRDGALFGDTPEQAFFVKCDGETNPRDVRERGQVVTEVGVAIVKPAEFVIFRIQQLTGS
jgi:phage tail sheath protein FI